MSLTESIADICKSRVDEAVAAERAKFAALVGELKTWGELISIETGEHFKVADAIIAKSNAAVLALRELVNQK